MMILRRRQMGNGSINVDSYVQSGLVFQLDGIDWGNQAGHWIERKNGYDWYEANNVNLHTEDDAMVFDGSNYMLTSDTIPDYSYSTHSIEACVSINLGATDSFPIINFGQDKVAVLKRSGNYNLICYIPASGSATSIRCSDPFDFSNISFNGNYYLDAILVETLSSYGPTNGMKQTEPIIGNAYKIATLSSYWFVGKIHSIRIYNRQITAEEIAFNYNIDKQRFNV